MYLWKLPVIDGTITKLYGTPPGPGIKYVKGYHTGVDVTSAERRVFAIHRGTIIAASYDKNGWGNYIVLRTADSRYDIIYAHLSKFLIVNGESVEAGQELGIMGATGQVRGIHLHLEIRKAPWINRNDVNPVDLLKIEEKLGTIKEKVEIEMEYAILKNSRDEDEMADRVSAAYGDCAVFKRKVKGGTYNPDFKKATIPITIGGPKTNLPGEIYLGGSGWEETSIAVAKHLLFLGK